MLWLFLIISPVLSIDSECYMTVPEIGEHFNYKSEVHLVRTKDDYILELHRFPCRQNETDCSRKKPIVFMQHGLLSDGFCYIPNMPSQSPGFVFADAGFDVWIANSRGTPASQKHIGFGPEDGRFWNFTWQQMSEFDLTSSVDYVLRNTSQDFLYYMGHSQGTMIMFARLAEDPKFGAKIKQFHALAPVATVSHIGGLFKLFGKSKFIMQDICTLDIGFIDGNEKMFNQSRVGVYLCHTPAATSVKDLQHWVQLVKSQKVAKFDYGIDGNIIEYGRSTPPEYDLSKIKTPTYLYWSKDDILADTEDIRETIWSKMNHTIAGSLEMPHYSHMDFVFGVNASVDLYPKIIQNIQNDYNIWKKQKIHGF